VVGRKFHTDFRLTRACVRVHACVRACVFVCMCACVCARACMCVCMHVRARARVCVCPQTDSSPLLFMNTPHTRPHNSFSCLSHDRLPLYSGTISLWLCSWYNCFLSTASGFHRKVDENCTLLGYYKARTANRLLRFQDNILVPSLGDKNPEVKLGQISCSETLVRNYHYMLHSDTEEHSSQLLLSFSSHLTKNTQCSDLKNTLSHLSS